jgi:hypothetical protein
MHQKSNRNLLIILQLHSIATNVANILESVDLHPLQSDVAHITLTLDWARLRNADRRIHPNPLRTESALVISIRVLNILRLSDEPLSAREREDIELFHFSRTLPLILHT